ncbi:MAG: hypothetical protein HZA93_12850 [Verrucomicrobia bacterium]|nr:hypothetical protein [Verrucomicrobiota bacterium]
MLRDNDGVPFAIDANGKFRDVADVERGLRCDCFCADCKGPLVAKKGHIRAHHFAHHDRHDCRHALEASLFGMLLTILRQPGATLMVPPCGDRHELVPRPHEIFTESQAAKFFRTPWVIEPATVSLDGAELAQPTISVSSADRPEIRTAELEVHVLSHRKREPEILPQIRRDGPAVLALDLRDYAALWWSVCDEHKDETLDAAMTATGVMRQWLQRQTGGRTWLYHPGLEQRRRKLRQWIAEHSRAAAEWRTREKLRYVPRHPPAVPPPTAQSRTLSVHPAEDSGREVVLVPVCPSGADAMPVGYIRRLKDAQWLTTHMAANIGLWQDQRSRMYVFLGRAGEPVPAVVQDMLDPANDWQPVFSTDAAHFVAAKELLRRSLAPYGQRPTT